MSADLPIIDDYDQSEFVDRHQAAELVGYTVTSFTTLTSREPHRWPGPVARVRVGRAWRHLWRVDELLEAVHRDPDTLLHNRPRVAGEDGLVECLECPEPRPRMRSLGRHLSAIHAMNATEYRHAHQLPATAALAGDAMRLALAQRMTDPEDPGRVAIRPYQTRERAEQIRPHGADVIRATERYDLNVTARTPGRKAGVEAMRQARLDVLTARVQSHGYDSLQDAIEDTRTLTVAAASTRTGLAASTISRRRRNSSRREPMGESNTRT